MVRKQFWSIQGLDHWKSKLLREEWKGEKIYCCHRAVGSRNFAEREWLWVLHFAVLSHIKELDLSLTERRLQREKIIFIMSINQCMWLQRFVGIVHSLIFVLRKTWPFVASRAVFLRKGTEGNICPVRQNGNWRASCKKGVYRILANFHFWQDRADFWQFDLFWLEKHCSIIFSVD